ncbi:hypothetical protein ACLQ26_01810 [Micromonospora sp. DT43]|uniref:hypothetical protein n=1 Tax=Micromonospora sp. DT43 TaxID=3393440 RepID=UPI003CFA6805
MVEPDQLAAARRRFPVGDHVTGRVVLIPRPGSIGLLVDLSHERWVAIKARFPIGSVVAAIVTHVFPSNREYVVRFGDCWSALEWDDEAPALGVTGTYSVVRHLEETRRIILAPADSSR